MTSYLIQHAASYRSSSNLDDSDDDLATARPSLDEENDQEALLELHNDDGYLDSPKSTRWFWLRTAYWCLHVILLVPAIYGWHRALAVHRGTYVHTPVYTDAQLAQAGWSRPALRNGTRSVATIFPSSSGNKTIVEISNMQAAVSEDPDDQHILVLTPMRNAQHSLPSFFRMLESLQHPKQNTSVGFLVGDEEDDTIPMLLDWIAIQERRAQYRRITLLKKDLNMLSPSGDVRHRNWIQAQRRYAWIFPDQQRQAKKFDNTNRKLMAKARTLLLTSTLRTDVDWVLWLDSDVAEASPTLIRDLYRFGGENGTVADVIAPNTARRRKGDKIHGYDLNK